MAQAEYNWQAAFVAFCNGVPLDEISTIFSIPLPSLRNKMSDEGWKALRNQLPLVTNTESAGVPANGSQVESDKGLPATVATRLKLVEANRMENLAVFVDLRRHLVESVQALANGTLKLEKVFNGRAGIVRTQVSPGPGDWLNIASYARTIADGTYRALGDFQAQEKPGQDAAAGTVQAPQPAITIILPGAIATPREERQITDAKAGQVIDVQQLMDAKAAK